MNYNHYIQMYHCIDKPVVTYQLYKQRLSRLYNRGILDDITAKQALTLSGDKYRVAHGARKTNIIINRISVCLNDKYLAHASGSISYENFRSRLKTYEAKLLASSIMHEPKIFEWAKEFDNSEWARVIGSGKAEPFFYDGKDYPSQVGITFCSLYHFLLTINQPEKFKLVRSRLKQKWGIDRAISTEKSENTGDTGTLYCMTCIPTQKSYIGITCKSIHERRAEHINEAKSGSQRLLQRTIRHFGADSFSIRPIQTAVPAELLPGLEKQLIKEKNSLYPFGLNSSAGGQFSRGAGNAVTISGRKYLSIAEASREFSRLTNFKVPFYVIASRIRAGERDAAKLTSYSRRVSDHPEAGKALFRRYRSLIRKNDVDSRWRDYDTFKNDVLDNVSLEQVESNNLVLSKRVQSLPYSHANFEWIPKSEAPVKRCGRKCVVFGREFRSVEDVARFYGIPASSLRYTIKVRAGSVEEAVVDWHQYGASSFALNGATILAANGTTPFAPNRST